MLSIFFQGRTYYVQSTCSDPGGTDDNGNPDVISGSWPGEIFLFRGTEDHSFAAPEMIKDKDGKFINIGRGIRKETMFRPFGQEQPEGLLIAGYAKFEHTPEGTFVNYHGQRLESTKERPIAITGTASAAHAADWDGDGDYDLIIGTIRGKVYLVPNEGTHDRASFETAGRVRTPRMGLAVPTEKNLVPFGVLKVYQKFLEVRERLSLQRMKDGETGRK